MAVLRRRILFVSLLVLVSFGGVFAQAEKVYVTKTGQQIPPGILLLTLQVED